MDKTIVRNGYTVVGAKRLADGHGNTVMFSLQSDAPHPTPITLTRARFEMLLRLAANGSSYVTGGEVIRVRGLVQLELAELQDDGAGGDKQNFLGERWVAKLTPLGEMLARQP
jgi:hypothetical protein